MFASAELRDIPQIFSRQKQKTNQIAAMTCILKNVRPRGVGVGGVVQSLCVILVWSPSCHTLSCLNILLPAPPPFLACHPQVYVRTAVGALPSSERLSCAN